MQKLLTAEIAEDFAKDAETYPLSGDSRFLTRALRVFGMTNVF
jgi:hypothetical protein